MSGGKLGHADPINLLKSAVHQIGFHRRHRDMLSATHGALLPAGEGMHGAAIGIKAPIQMAQED